MKYTINVSEGQTSINIIQHPDGCFSTLREAFDAACELANWSLVPQRKLAHCTKFYKDRWCCLEDGHTKDCYLFAEKDAHEVGCFANANKAIIIAHCKNKELSFDSNFRLHSCDCTEEWKNREECYAKNGDFYCYEDKGHEGAHIYK